MKEHIRRIKSKEIYSHYLGKNIQNEIIQILSKAVKEKIVVDLKASKYYSIFVDCIPDISHTEQMTIILRFVLILPTPDEKESYVDIREHFLSFIDINDTTGAGMTEKILETLDSHGISMQDLRGQGYDNGSNMRGKQNGVQAKILHLNSRAFYVPCSSHSLNLVVNDAVGSCLDAVTFFDIVQHLFVFFSSSTQRWNVLRQFVKGLTLKGLCETRWASRIDALKPLRHQLREIIQALESFWNIELPVSSVTATKNKTESRALLQKIDFKFVCCLITWYDVLSQIEITSKFLQEVNINIPQVVSLISNTLEYVKDYRTDEQLQKMLETARKLSVEQDIEPEFEKKRGRTKKRMFAYESHKESMTEEDSFKINFFKSILDHAIESLQDWFEILMQHNNQFNFLYSLNAKNITEDELLKKMHGFRKIIILQ
ncbi:zinc finger MYM-type protein 1-like [Hydra vulgaris]|uniref:Zinc finger MYM-type protein 1-like n=1 Tax=Hydra vulgaris TaxID=6087 RepID=A0ABM4CS90_HYDVU